MNTVQQGTEKVRQKVGLRGRHVVFGLFLLLAAAAIYAGLASGGIRVPGASASSELISADRIISISVDTDGDARADDYEIILAGVLETFENPEGQVRLSVVGEVRELVPLGQ
jgi:hypothetical protein